MPAVHPRIPASFGKSRGNPWAPPDHAAQSPLLPPTDGTDSEGNCGWKLCGVPKAVRRRVSTTRTVAQTVAIYRMRDNQLPLHARYLTERRAPTSCVTC